MKSRSHESFGFSQGKQGDECFMKLPGKSCNETSAYLKGRASGSTCRVSQTNSGMEPSWMTSKTSSHAAQTKSSMLTYYSNPEVIAMATNYLMPDLQAFGYDFMHASDPIKDITDY